MLKVGDRVRYTIDHKIGAGTIVSPANNGPRYWWVDFDINHNSNNDAKGKGRMGHCYTVGEDRLELINETPFEQLVRVYINQEQSRC